MNLHYKDSDFYQINKKIFDFFSSIVGVEPTSNPHIIYFLKGKAEITP